MSKKIYTGVNNIARNVSKFYVGVNGVARKVKKAYVGVNGVAQQFWGDSKPTGRYFRYNDDFQPSIMYSLKLEDISKTISRWIQILIDYHDSLPDGLKHTVDIAFYEKLDEERDRYINAMVNSIPSSHNFIILKSNGSSSPRTATFELYSAQIDDPYTYYMGYYTTRTEDWTPSSYATGDYYSSMNARPYNFEKTRCCKITFSYSNNQVVDVIDTTQSTSIGYESYYCGTMVSYVYNASYIFTSSWMSNIGIEIPPYND